MMAAWMLQALLVSLLLAGAAWVLDALMALYRLPRRGVWLGAVILALLLPVLGLLPSAPAADGMAAEPAAAYAEGSGGDAAGHAPGVARHTVSGDVAFPVVGNARTFSFIGDYSATLLPAAARHPAAGVLLALGWLLAAGALLCTLLLSARRFLRRRPHWRREVVADTQVYVTRDDGPAVIGLRRPSILVPAWLLALTAERQRMVVTHEREHVRRGDHVIMATAAVLAALLPWNLPLQWMLARLRLAVELDCDRRVLAAGAPAREYGAMLIDIASRSQRLPLAVALTGGETELERRIRAMTWKMPRLRSARAACGALVAALLVLVACEVDLLDPALQESTVGDVVDAAFAAEPTLTRAADVARIYVDGERVSLDDIRGRRMEEFTLVNVVRPELSRSGSTEVRLTTAAAAARAARDSAPGVERGREALTGALRAVPEGVPAEGTPADAAERLRSARALYAEALRHARADTLRAAEARGTGILPRATAPRPGEVEAARGTRAVQVAVKPGEVRAVSVPQRAALPIEAARKPSMVRGVPGETLSVAVPLRSVQVTGRQVEAPSRNVAGAGREAGALPDRTPLFVVDGVIVRRTVLDLNSLDIERIEILKGDAAYQAYGAAGANGVVLITTRR